MIILITVKKTCDNLITVNKNCYTIIAHFKGSWCFDISFKMCHKYMIKQKTSISTWSRLKKMVIKLHNKNLFSCCESGHPIDLERRKFQQKRLCRLFEEFELQVPQPSNFWELQCHLSVVHRPTIGRLLASDLWNLSKTLVF